MLRNRFQVTFILTSILLFGIISFASGQSSRIANDKIQDTIIYNRLKDLQQPDTIHNQFVKTGKKGDVAFSYKSYVDFLLTVNDTSKYIIIPLDEFKGTINPKKIIIGLRHDVDVDLNKAVDLATVENNFGISSIYYILHTAGYYLANSNNMAIHNESIIPVLKKMQNDYHHEIGWHNDLVTLQLVYKIDPVIFLHQELNWLRSKGLNIHGTASHGSSYCYTYKYLNYYFFEEFKNPTVGQFVNNDSAFVEFKWVKIKHGILNEFGLDYEAYFLNNNKYYSDASFINGMRWNINMLNLSTLSPGDRVIILMHPIYYSPVGSNLAEITSFSLAGQITSEINPDNATIKVVMPKNIKQDSLCATFLVSPYARVMLGKKELLSNCNSINFTNPVNIKIVAEDGLTFKNWLVYFVYSDYYLSLQASNLLIGAYADSFVNIQVISNTIWHIESNKAWLTADVENGTGNGIVKLTAKSNTEGHSRSATVKVSGNGIADQNISVTQEAGISGIKSTDNPPLISVYPNPSQTVLFVKGIEQNSTVSVFDLSGRLLIKNQIVDKMIDISSLVDGMYIIKITHAGVITTIKFLKK